MYFCNKKSCNHLVKKRILNYGYNKNNPLNRNSLKNELFFTLPYFKYYLSNNSTLNFPETKVSLSSKT